MTCLYRAKTITSDEVGEIDIGDYEYIDFSKTNYRTIKIGNYKILTRRIQNDLFWNGYEFVFETTQGDNYKGYINLNCNPEFDFLSKFELLIKPHMTGCKRNIKYAILKSNYKDFELNNKRHDSKQQFEIMMRYGIDLDKIEFMSYNEFVKKFIDKVRHLNLNI